MKHEFWRDGIKIHFENWNPERGPPFYRKEQIFRTGDINLYTRKLYRKINFIIIFWTGGAGTGMAMWIFTSEIKIFIAQKCNFKIYVISNLKFSTQKIIWLLFSDQKLLGWHPGILTSENYTQKTICNSLHTSWLRAGPFPPGSVTPCLTAASVRACRETRVSRDTVERRFSLCCILGEGKVC